MARLAAEGTEEAQARIENLNELVAAASELEHTLEHPQGLEAVAAFLEQAALVSDLDEADPRRSAITLMTLHNSKGLEFPIVYLIGMEEGVFPHARSLDEGGIEEERRLCYVGMTRARERLVLTRARRRLLFGNPQENPASRFLLEIPASLVRAIGTATRDDDDDPVDESDGWRRETVRPGWTRDAGSAGWRASPSREWRNGGGDRDRSAARGSEPRVDYSFSQEAEISPGFRPGTRVRHPEFGEGIVRRREGTGAGEKLTVQFERGGLKKLIARFAPLTVV